jgi:hypothetical protein
MAGKRRRWSGEEDGGDRKDNKGTRDGDLGEVPK